MKKNNVIKLHIIKLVFESLTIWFLMVLCFGSTNSIGVTGSHGHSYVDQRSFETWPTHVPRTATARNHTKGFGFPAQETRHFLSLPSSPVP